MKKIFLFLFILAYSFASAQQNEFFNIQKYMQKKQAESKKTQFKIQPFTNNLITSFHPSSLQPQLMYELPNGNKVYALPQDHMPCIKPDMSQFNMPNSFKQKPYRPFLLKTPGIIPNPAVPLLELSTS